MHPRREKEITCEYHHELVIETDEATRAQKGRPLISPASRFLHRSFQHSTWIQAERSSSRTISLAGETSVA